MPATRSAQRYGEQPAISPGAPARGQPATRYPSSVTHRSGSGSTSGSVTYDSYISPSAADPGSR